MSGDISYLSPVFNTTGLLLDIVGVYVLSRGVLISKKTAASLAGTHWNSNPHLEKALSQQSRDAMRGLCIIVPGFGLQILGTWLARLT